jgi:hypothetical protein
LVTAVEEVVAYAEHEQVGQDAEKELQARNSSCLKRFVLVCHFLGEY